LNRSLTLWLASVLLTAPCVTAETPEQPERQPYEQVPNMLELARAFDGAMTCAALTYIKADDINDENAWRWANRSFAFGMLAAKFFTDAQHGAVSADDLNGMRAEYTAAFTAMTPAERAPFEESCAGKYADMDRLCEENTCVHTPPE
jgi:hypothetical protein